VKALPPLPHIEALPPAEAEASPPAALDLPPPAPAPPPPAPLQPGYDYLLSDGRIRSGHETVLSVAVSGHDIAGLAALLKAHQASSRAAQDRAPAVGGSGQLATSRWSSFQYVKAVILHCPAFLNCDGDPAPRSTEGDPMIWDFVLSAKDSSRTQDGVIIVSFSGAATPEGPFIEIASLPGLMAGVNVVRDANWWEQKMTGWEGVLNTLHGLLEALGAVLVLLWGWRGWLRLRPGKADAPPGPPPAGNARGA
jgi:hypothetical protein